MTEKKSKTENLEMRACPLYGKCLKQETRTERFKDIVCSDIYENCKTFVDQVKEYRKLRSRKYEK